VVVQDSSVGGQGDDGKLAHDSTEALAFFSLAVALHLQGSDDVSVVHIITEVTSGDFFRDEGVEVGHWVP
jgi:hypothetical protein